MSNSSCALALGFTALLALSAAQAQTSGGSLPLLPSTEQPARTGLLDLVRQIQAQLDALPQNPQNSEQVAALRSELEVLVLQAEIEKLQRDNASLEGQLQRSTGGSGAAVNGTSANETPSDVALEQRIAQLSEQQSNLNAQLSAMSEQHAQMLEQQLSGAAPAETASSGSAASGSTASGSAASGTTLNSAPGLGPSNTNVSTQAQNQVQTQPQTQGQPRVYIVRPGDSLSKLAVAYYGRAQEKRWADILAANPQIMNPNVLFVGTRLVIPQ